MQSICESLAFRDLFEISTLLRPSLPLLRGRFLRWIFAVVLVHSVPATPVIAQLPLIRLDRVQPLGGKAGTKVEVEIQGRDFDDLQGLRFDHPGLKSELLKDRKFQISIADAVPNGTYELRAVGRFGISGVRLFHVQNSLNEIKEIEPNDSPEKAQVVPVNSVVNGTCDGNGDDFFRVSLRKGQRIVVDALGFRLDSTVRAILSLLGSEGRVFQQSRPYFHRTDPLLDFVAPGDGEYLIRLHDMTFSGGLPYRLLITDQPYPENVFPSAVRPGEKTSLTVWGRNLSDGKPTTGPTIHDAPLEQTTITFESPKEIETGFLTRFHMASPALNARGLQLFVANSVHPKTVALADAPVFVEKEPNDTRETAEKIELPAVIAGRFDKPGDGDWFTFAAKANQAYAVDLLCERLDFPGDPYVVIFDAKGNEVASFDDHGVNFNALGQFNRDGVGTFRAPRDERYTLFVKDRYGQGGARFQYVVRIVKAEPDFFPVMIHETNPDPTCPLLLRGGTSFMEICLNRRDYNGPITLEVEGLPKGVVCSPTHISPQTQTGTLVFSASKDAEAWTGAFRVKASAVVEGKKIVRDVRPAQRRWAIANINPCVMLRESCLAVRTEQAPYMLTMPKDRLTVEAGKAVEAKLAVERFGEFKGKLQLTGLNLPPGFALATTDVSDGQTDANLKFTVAGNVPPGDYSLFVRGDGQVPFQRDAKMTNRPNVRVANPSTALQILVVPSAKK